jgi:hypothetical protein
VKGGGSLKVKRGGTGKISNSGGSGARLRTRNFNVALRNFKKPSKKHKRTHDHRHEPLIPRAPAVWDPTDPIIVAYREAHPRVEAAWRFYGARLGGPDV